MGDKTKAKLPPRSGCTTSPVLVPPQLLDAHLLPTVLVNAEEHAFDYRLATSKQADLILGRAKGRAQPLGGLGTHEDPVRWFISVG
jgi:hypothetical protein